ncbi:MAG TPA: carboxylesterase family protein [Clostridia bacterium]
MKKTCISLFLITIILVTTVLPAFSAESDVDLSVCIAPSQALKTLEDQVKVLDSSSFVDKCKADKNKKELLNEIAKVVSKVKDGKLKNSIEYLDKQLKKDIRKLIVSDVQQKLVKSIDDVVISIDDALKTTVLTESGYVAGFDCKFNSWAWTGIPYAKPPVGELRWKAPQNPDSWKNIRYSTNDYSKCAQASINKQWEPLNKVVGSEDCLYLNVYRPKTAAKNLPVYFWIHGGGNASGGADDYFWSSILSGYKDVVVVVVQYRLGLLGWFSNPALNTKGTVEEKSGNFGTLDQIKALKWVKKNIEKFGGDPGNVTVGGESSGGCNTLNLMISPLAKGLFNKAVIESAGDASIPVSEGTKSSNLAIDKLLVRDGKCRDLASAAAYRSSMTNRQVEAYLRKKSAEDIQGALVGEAGNVSGVYPFIDGEVLPGAVPDMIESGNYNHVPVIIGSNQYEMKAFLPSVFGSVTTSSGHKWSEIYNAIGVSQPAITLEELMPSGGYDRELYEACGKYPSMYWKAGMVDAFARSLKKHQDDVYAYQFNWGGEGSGTAPFDFLIGAGHAFELPFFFGWNVDIWNSNCITDANRPGRDELQKAMMTYLARFMYTGDPNKDGTGIPRWEKWSNITNDPKCMIFDADFSKAKLSMSNEELTREDVMSQIDALPSYQKDMIKYLLWY